MRHLDFSRHGDLEIYWSYDPNGRSRLGPEAVDRLGLRYIVKYCRGKAYTFTDFHLNAINVFHDVCGYGGEDGEEKLLRLFGMPKAHFVPD